VLQQPALKQPSIHYWLYMSLYMRLRKSAAMQTIKLKSHNSMQSWPHGQHDIGGRTQAGHTLYSTVDQHNSIQPGVWPAAPVKKHQQWPLHRASITTAIDPQASTAAMLRHNHTSQCVADRAAEHCSHACMPLSPNTPSSTVCTLAHECSPAAVCIMSWAGSCTEPSYFIAFFQQC